MRINVIVIKKDEKVNIDLSQIKYYNCYKKRYYINNCSNK